MHTEEFFYVQNPDNRHTVFFNIFALHLSR